jgi:hypothetical protein
VLRGQSRKTNKASGPHTLAAALHAAHAAFAPMWQRTSRSVVACASAAAGAAGFVSSQTSLAEPKATSWGGGQLGQLGHPGEADRPLPTVIEQLKGVPVTQLVSGPSAMSSAAVSATGEEGPAVARTPENVCCSSYMARPC